MTLRLAVTALLLLVFCAEIQSYRIEKREEPKSYLEQMQGLLSGTWDQLSSGANTLIEKVKDATGSERIVEIYNKGTSAVGTYASILSDQVYHLWTGA